MTIGILLAAIVNNATKDHLSHAAWRVSLFPLLWVVGEEARGGNGEGLSMRFPALITIRIDLRFLSPCSSLGQPSSPVECASYPSHRDSSSSRTEKQRRSNPWPSSSKPMPSLTWSSLRLL